MWSLGISLIFVLLVLQYGDRGALGKYAVCTERTMTIKGGFSTDAPLLIEEAAAFRGLWP